MPPTDDHSPPEHSIAGPSADLSTIFHRSSRSQLLADEVRQTKTIYKPEDIARARENILKHTWAQTRNRSIVNTAKSYLSLAEDEMLTRMIPTLTPATTSICPNCVTKGYHWHANGNWAWTFNNPDKITCNVCKMEFPNAAYPESLSLPAKNVPGQTITYVDIEPQKCIGYTGCRPSINAVIRGKKIQYVIARLETLGQAYVLSGETVYAEAAKKIMLRLADVVPNYLVFEGYAYSEYADCDPAYAALNLLNLSADPTKKCRLITATGYVDNPTKMYSGYWSSSRLGSSGMDGSHVRSIAIAYDLIADALSAADKEKIEKNLIEELCLMALGDNLINNKAVGNREGAAYSGLAIDAPNLARFGLDGFMLTMDDYWLPDGGGPESPAYSFMTLSQIYRYGFAFRDYTEPEEFDPGVNKTRYVNFNANTDTTFDQVFQNLIWTSLGNYLYPPLADSYTTTTMSSVYAEYLEYSLQTNQFDAYLGDKMRGIKTPSVSSLFYRDPDVANFTTDHFTHPDVVFPYLSQGFLRTGKNGEKSAAILDASPWGSHHHYDSLNLVYWKDGRELLLDLGYLWDHANSSKTKQTKVHNTVVVDETNQISTSRNGGFSTFVTWPGIKIMQAGSDAYAGVDVYNRTIVQIEYGEADYIVDIFRVETNKRKQYTFHGPHHNYTLNSDLVFDQSRTEDIVDNHFCIMLHVLSPGHIEVSDVVLTEEDSTDNMMTPFPNETPDRCVGVWCYYLGNGAVEWSSVPGKSTRGVKLTATPSATGVTNCALNFGNTNGYRGQNAFVGKIGYKYTVTWWMRGTTEANPRLLYWKDDDINNTGARSYVNPISSNFPTISTAWQQYTATYYLGKQIPPFKFGTTDKSWDAQWQIDDNYTFTAHFPKRSHQRVYYEDGWGQRDYRDTDYGVTLPYFYIEGSNTSNYTTFVGVYEGAYNDESIVKGVSMDDHGNGNVGVKINTRKGTDYVLSTTDYSTLKSFGRKTDANVAVEAGANKVMVGGTFYDYRTTHTRRWHGRTTSYNNDKSNSWWVIKTSMSKNDIVGQSFHVTEENVVQRAYPIRRIESTSGGLKIFTRYDYVGFRLDANVDWYVDSITDINDPAAGKVMGFVSIGVVVGAGLIYAIFIVIDKKKARPASTIATGIIT